MKRLAKLGYLAAACALLITTFSIVGPRAVAAAVATLVQVSNSPANPIPTVATDNPALQPFAQTVINPPGNLSLRFSAPAGKTWAIEAVNVVCSGVSVIPTGQTTDVRLFMTTGGNALQYTFAPKQVDGNTELIVNESIRVYADPDTLVIIGSGAGVPPDYTCSGVVSGHLVSPPI